MPELSIVIPLFNEEKNLTALNERILKIIDITGRSWEIIYVNDGSRDQTAQLLESIASDNSNIKCISLTRNFGHQAALMAGLDHSAGDAIITMDGDLQDPPELIPELIKKWKDGFPIVHARRENYRKDNFIKRWMSMLFYFTLDKFKIASGPKNVGDFRLIDKKVLLELLRMRERTRYLRGMITWMGFEHTFVEYSRPDRVEGKAGYSFTKLTKLALDGVFSFSRLPLRIGFFIGIISILIGTGFMVYMIADILINDVYYHLYKLLVDVIFIFMGFLFILIWILGEYIGRIYHEVKGRDLYIIENKINLK
jgi:polyisoprenyl-phosphate glycosyltransferase